MGDIALILIPVRLVLQFESQYSKNRNKYGSENLHTDAEIFGSVKYHSCNTNRLMYISPSSFAKVLTPPCSQFKDMFANKAN